MSVTSLIRRITGKLPVMTAPCRHISTNTKARLTHSKSNLLLEVPAKIPVAPAVAIQEAEWEGAQTKYATFHHPLPADATLPAGINKQVFAVVDIQGKQYKVLQKDMVMVNHIRGVEVGDQLSFTSVFLLGGRNFSMLGQPVVPNVNVIATVREQTTTQTINVFKMKRRTGYRKLMRYRDQVTILQIDKIDVAMDLPDVAPTNKADLPINYMQKPVQL